MLNFSESQSFFTADITVPVIGISLVILAAAVFYERLPKTNPSWLKHILVFLFSAVMGIFAFAVIRFTTITDSIHRMIVASTDVIRIGFFIAFWMLTALAIYTVLPFEKSVIKKSLLSFLIGFTACLFVTPIFTVTAEKAIVVSEKFRLLFGIILAVVWMIGSNLFYGVFEPRMPKLQRILLALICGLLVTVMLRLPLYQALFGGVG